MHIFWYLSRLKTILVETILYSSLNYKTTILYACSSQHISVNIYNVMLNFNSSCRTKIISMETILYSLLNYKTTILCTCSSQHISRPHRVSYKKACIWETRSHLILRFMLSFEIESLCSPWRTSWPIKRTSIALT